MLGILTIEGVSQMVVAGEGKSLCHLLLFSFIETRLVQHERILMMMIMLKNMCFKQPHIAIEL